MSGWNWSSCENKPVVEIYALGTEAELFCNGKSIGRKPSGEQAGYRTLFDTVYEQGTLTAVRYAGDGSETGRMELALQSQ